jgi:hypothetical protein
MIKKLNHIPITAALCSSLPFFFTIPSSSTYYPLSIYFFALSQAPPILFVGNITYQCLKLI